MGFLRIEKDRDLKFSLKITLSDSVYCKITVQIIVKYTDVYHHSRSINKYILYLHTLLINIQNKNVLITLWFYSVLVYTTLCGG